MRYGKDRRGGRFRICRREGARKGREARDERLSLSVAVGRRGISRARTPDKKARTGKHTTPSDSDSNSNFDSDSDSDSDSNAAVAADRAG